MILREPLIQRRRNQQQLVRLERSERLIHRPGLDHPRLHRRHLEKTVITIIRRHTRVSQHSPQHRSTPTRVLRTHAEHVQHPQRCQGAVDAVPALGPDAARRSARTRRPPRGRRAVRREGEVAAIPGDHLVDGVDLLEGLRSRRRRRTASRARTPTRTARRRRPRAAGAGRCGWSSAGVQRCRAGRSRSPTCSRASHGRSLCPSITGCSASSVGDAGEGVWARSGMRSFNRSPPTMGT